jgi:hypothetical protein
MQDNHDEIWAWIDWMIEHIPSAWMRRVRADTYAAFYVDIYDVKEADAYRWSVWAVKHKLIDSPDLRAGKRAERQRLSSARTG